MVGGLSLYRYPFIADSGMQSSSTISASVPTPTPNHPFQRKIDEIKPSKP